MGQTVFSLLSNQASARPSAVALLSHGREALSFDALARHVRATVSALIASDLARGDRLAIVLPNGAEMATACLAASCAFQAAPINPDLKLPEYVTALSRLGVKAVLTLAGGEHPVRQAAQSLGLRVIDLVMQTASPAGVFAIAGAATGGAVDESSLSAPDDVALVLQTSGTTSASKTVPLTHANLTSSAHNLVGSLALTADDRCLHFLPMFHIGGVVDVLLAPLSVGGSAVILPGYSSPEFERDLIAYKPTWIQAVPVMLQEMLSALTRPEAVDHMRRLRFARSVSAPLPAPLMQAFEERFGAPTIEIFGMTETAGVITSNPLPPRARKTGSVGVPVGPEVVLLGADRRKLGAGETGEVAVRGANVFAGYEGAAEENARAFEDGWFKTGDLAVFDADGYLSLTGRVKDMINRGGEKVTPQEVDDALLAHPSVADAASFGVPHPVLGEDVAALVVPKDASFSKEALLADLRARLAFFKVPRAILIVDAIPRQNGKLQRAVLTARFAEQMSAASTRAAYTAPQSIVALSIAAMWSEILGKDQIGVDDDFFDIGGDSLKAASFINALQSRWGETIYVSSVFDASTIAKYERYLSIHYPEMVARMKGASLQPQADRIERITPSMVASLQGMIARTLPPLKNKMAVKNRRAVFILSPPRSGSTLLRAMMAGNRELFAPPELYLLAYEDMAERKRWFSGSHRSQLEGCVRAVMQATGKTAAESQALIDQCESDRLDIKAFYSLMQDWIGDQVLVDKTPAYAVDGDILRRAEDYFEDAVYIHLLRHPYGMIRSFEEAKLDQLWFPRLIGSDAQSLDAFPFARRQLAEMIWLILNQNILAFLKDVPKERHISIRFEDIVRSPKESMENLCRVMRVGFDPEMLKPQSDSRRRMTDGIHDVSRMIGDPKFHQHQDIDPTVADQWKDAYEIDFLCDETTRLAESLGYHETLAGLRGREDFEI